MTIEPLFNEYKINFPHLVPMIATKNFLLMQLHFTVSPNEGRLDMRLFWLNEPYLSYVKQPQLSKHQVDLLSYFVQKMSMTSSLNPSFVEKWSSIPSISFSLVIGLSEWSLRTGWLANVALWFYCFWEITFPFCF